MENPKDIIEWIAAVKSELQCKLMSDGTYHLTQDTMHEIVAQLVIKQIAVEALEMSNTDLASEALSRIRRIQFPSTH